MLGGAVPPLSALPVTTILVPLDGSRAGECALPVAAAVARAHGARVRPVHVIVPAADDPSGSVGGDQAQTAIADLRADAQRYLGDVRDRFSEQLPSPIEDDVVASLGIRSPFGEAAAVAGALGRLADRRRANLLVMATHGRGGVSRAWLGSVADTLIRQSRVPLLLLRPPSGEHAPTGVFRRILVPLDGSPEAEEVLPLALALAAPDGAQLVLLRVAAPRRRLAPSPPLGSPNAALLAREVDGARAYLSRVARGLGRPGLAADIEVKVDDHVSASVLRAADELRADLVAMTTHGRGGARRLALGSVADKIVRAASCPVLLHRPAGRASSAHSARAAHA